MLVKSTAAALDAFGQALGAIGAVTILSEAEQENDKKAGKWKVIELMPGLEWEQQAFGMLGMVSCHCRNHCCSNGYRPAGW